MSSKLTFLSLLCALVFLVLACSDEGSSPLSEDPTDDAGSHDSDDPDSGVDFSVNMPDSTDGADQAIDSTSPGPPEWHAGHCANRECFYVMQNEAGADDFACNGRRPTDMGTTDGEGLRDCPFASFQNLTLLDLLAPYGDVPNTSRTFFVGEGDYPVWPWGLNLRGDGDSADEAVILTNYAGGDVTLDGTCPTSCTVETPEGPVTLEPCCFLECPTCDAHQLCVPVTAEQPGQCGVPWENVREILRISGQWVRIEGFTLAGCALDGIRVDWRTTAAPPELIPNDHVFIVNNTIHGCDINENIKGAGAGPGPAHGGPVWGPTYVIGNELLGMASQGIDATGVHNWLVEDNYLHDAKEGELPDIVAYDGGGIGFKNGGSQARVRNNWLVNGGGISMGGVSGSCIESTTPPIDWGCFQDYEMTDMLVENNVVIDSPIDGVRVYQCDDCRLLGNVFSGIRGSAAVFMMDDCPGPRCPDHNPDLLPTRSFLLERNYVSAGTWHGEGPVWFGYHRDVHAVGPAGNGMTSRDNIFCAPDGIDESDDPPNEVEMMGHGNPTQLYTLEAFRSHISDIGSTAYNDPNAAVAPCMSAPPSCEIGVQLGDGEVRWSGPDSCDDCSCTLVWGDVEEAVSCTGATAIPQSAADRGRRYVGLRVNRPNGGTSCGASYNIASLGLGPDCAISIEESSLEWTADGGLQCRVLGDGDSELEVGPCSGNRSLPEALLAAGRHHLRLQVLESSYGQTACGVMYNR